MYIYYLAHHCRASTDITHDTTYTAKPTLSSSIHSHNLSEAQMTEGLEKGMADHDEEAM